MNVIARRKHERIKKRLRGAGTSLAQIARQLDVTPTTVTTVSMGYRRSRRIEAAIAASLQDNPASIWPERYPSK